jgi:hypothetical protein
MILVAIDRLTKMARFIPTQSSVTSKETADLFLREVFRHHGLPSSIISDRDLRFTAKFWEALQEALGVKLLMSTAEHWSGRSRSQDNPETPDTLCIPSTGLGGVIAFSRIRL